MNSLVRGLPCTITVVLLTMLASAGAGAQEGLIGEAERLEAQVVQLYQQGKYADAIPLQERALAITEKVRGAEHPDTAACLDDLATLHRHAGADAKAEPLLERALAIREKALGPEDPATVASLNSLASVYRANGRYARAEPLFQRVLAIREKLSGPTDPDTATALNNLGELYRAAGRYPKAEPLLQRALTIRARKLGYDNPATAASLNNLASLYRDAGRYAKAAPLFQRAVAIFDKVSGSMDLNTATALNNLGELYYTAGEYAKAGPPLRRALAIRAQKLGYGHPVTAGSLNNLAALYGATAEYAKAEELYQQALEVSDRMYGPGNPATASFLNNLAALYRDTGAYARAEPLLRRALEIRGQALGWGHPDSATSLSNLGELYQTIGAYAKAEPLLLRTLAIREKVLGEESPDTARSLNNLALLYRDTGAYDRAEPLFLRALAIREKLGPEAADSAPALNNLAELYHAIGAYDKAEPLFQRALAICEKSFGHGHPHTAAALVNLAGLYRDTGDYARAEPLLLRALAIRRKALGLQHADTADSLVSLADLYSASGDHAKAQPFLAHALAIQEKALGRWHPATAATLDDLARQHYATGAYAQAASYRARAQLIEEHNTRLFLVSGSEARQQAFLQLRRTRTFFDVSFALAQPTAQSAALALTSLLQYKGRVLDSMSDSAARLRGSVAPQDQELFDRLSAVAQEESTLTYSPPEKLSAELVQQRLTALGVAQEQLQAQLTSRSAAFRHSVTPITLEAVRQALPSRSVLLEWLRYEPYDPGMRSRGAARYAVLLLRPAGEPVAIDLGPAQPIEDLVAELLRALSDPGTTYHQAVLQDLSARLIRPLSSHLVPGEQLLLATDAALNLVPFAALVDEHGDPFTERYDLTYLTSGRDLLRFGTEPPPRAGAVVLADPRYGQPADADDPADASTARGGLRFAPLPGTATEAADVQSLLGPDTQVLTGALATKEALRDLQGPRVLHLATHAFFLGDPEAAMMSGPAGPDRPGVLLSSEDNPLLRSGLALAGANERHPGMADNGILTAAEAAQLDLQGTELAVLSACETGVGTLQAGEGVYGLRRALVLAGAQAQVVSLWKVADGTTQELMHDYYSRLRRGEGRSAALQAVQRAMLAGDKKHPYYWAAFILIGDWRPLNPQAGPGTH